MKRFKVSGFMRVAPLNYLTTFDEIIELGDKATKEDVKEQYKRMYPFNDFSCKENREILSIEEQ